MRLHPDDRRRPASVPWYLERTRLRLWRGLLRSDDDVIPAGHVTAARLLRASKQRSDIPGGRPELLYLDIPGGPRSKETMRGFRPVAGRFSAPCYVNARAATDAPGHVDLQYWFFYAFNGRRRHVTHQGDWEHVTVRVTEEAAPQLVAVYFSAHGVASGRWVAPGPPAGGHRPLLVAPSGGPVVYSALGSHASYPGPGRNRRKRFQSSDMTADGGPVWDTAADLVIVEIGGRRTSESHAWLDFPGRWGAIRRLNWPVVSSGPPGPSHQRAWRAEPPLDRAVESGNTP